MKLSRGKRQSPVSPPFVCHHISARNISHSTRSPNERALIPIIWPSQNLLIVPYYMVPLLISLVLCVILSSESRSFFFFGDSLNCSSNEYLIQCTSLRPSVFLFFMYALKPLLNSSSRGKGQHGHKLSSGVLVPFTLTLTLQLLTANAHSPSVQVAFLSADSMDSYEHEEEDNEQTAYPTIKTLVNGSVGLPCNISQTKEENSIKLILWYKNNILGTPIYSIDARDSNVSQARHFLGSAYRGRASFELNLASRLALLVVRPLIAEDEGHYICRVDYRWTRTTISNVKLDVIVPPQRLRVIQLHQWSAPVTSTGHTTNGSGVGSLAVGTRQRDNGSEMHWPPPPQQHPVYLQTSVLSILHNGSMINEIETVRQPEETELTMYCDSIGARPRSMVKWYRLHQWERALANTTALEIYSELHSTDEKALQLIDDSFKQVNWTEPHSNPLPTNFDWHAASIEAPVTNGDVSLTEMVRNELHLGTVRDANQGQLYLCRTSNSNLSKPLDAIVRLEIYTRPKSIQIRQQLSSKDLFPPPSGSSDSPILAKSDWDSSSHPEEGHLVRNRTLHSISLLDYYLNANQPLMTVPPLRLRSGFESELLCQSNGSRPAAKIVWLLRDYRTNTEKDITELSSSYFNGHDTLSLLHFVPKFTDNRASLICRAANEALRQASISGQHNKTSPRNGHRTDHYGGANKSQMTPLTTVNLHFQLQTSVLLDVNYKPIVSMVILSGEQMYRQVAQPKTTGPEQAGNVKTLPDGNHKQEPQSQARSKFVESQEIFFNCSINANPQVHLVHWFFNGKALHTDLAKGLIITNSNRTMIVSSATKENAGYFHCSATNLLGETISDRHQIDILYEPQCRVEYTQTWYHQLGDIVQLKCQVLANPVDNLQFAWQFNGSALEDLSEKQWLHANRSSVNDHTAMPIEENFVIDQREKAARLAAGSNDKSRGKTNLPHSTRSTTHSSSQQQHLITNVVRVELRAWTSFGHFSCQASNQVGPQKEACKWHIVPHHYHPHQHQDSSGEHLSSGKELAGQQKHQHRYHHRHHQQQQSLSSDQHHSHWASAASTLNNCQIIESSNAVVIKCLETATDAVEPEQGISQDFLAQIGSDHNPSTIDRVGSATSPASLNGEFARVNHAEIPTRLTYHVQVFQLSDIRANTSTIEDNVDWNGKRPDTNGAGQTNYFSQIDQPEPGKRIAFKSPTSSLPSTSASFSPVSESAALVMDTINFTNPLFVISNLTASTSYLLKIWSSPAHMDSVLEQVNITVRTRANEDLHGPYSSDQIRPADSISATLASLLRMSSQKLLLLLTVVALICILFVAITLTYTIFKIRAILEIRKARREVNVNESISALETALCEMRPEQLENDLKSKTHFSVDTYRPYISVDNASEDCLVVTDTALSCTQGHFGPDSSVITYPNYLYPSMTSGRGCTVAHKNGTFKLNCSDEESVSTSNTSASNRSMLTASTESSNINSNYASECTKQDQLDTRCFAPPVTLDSGANLLLCMQANELAPSRSSHAFLVPEQYHSYPLQLHILPESNEDLSGCNLTPSVAVVSNVQTPSADQCAYLSASIETPSHGTMVDFPLSLAACPLGSEPMPSSGQKSIQTAV